MLNNSFAYLQSVTECNNISAYLQSVVVLCHNVRTLRNMRNLVTSIYPLS